MNRNRLRQDRRTGHIVRWNDEKGYGFAECPDHAGDVFVHISEIPNGLRPSQNDLVTFGISQDEQGRHRAVDIEFLKHTGRIFLRPHWSVVIGICYVLAMGLYGLLYEIPWFVPVTVGLMSAVTYGAYLLDKTRAQLGGWRIPENTLQLCSLFGGWPGALYAQWSIRHKNRKLRFQFTFWIVVIVNVAMTGFLFMPRWSEPVLTFFAVQN